MKQTVNSRRDAENTTDNAHKNDENVKAIAPSRDRALAHENMEHWWEDETRRSREAASNAADWAEPVSYQCCDNPCGDDNEPSPERSPHVFLGEDDGPLRCVDGIDLLGAACCLVGLEDWIGQQRISAHEHETHAQTENVEHDVVAWKVQEENRICGVPKGRIHAEAESDKDGEGQQEGQKDEVGEFGSAFASGGCHDGERLGVRREGKHENAERLKGAFCVSEGSQVGNFQAFHGNGVHQHGAGACEEGKVAEGGGEGKMAGGFRHAQRKLDDSHHERHVARAHRAREDGGRVGGNKDNVGH